MSYNYNVHHSQTWFYQIIKSLYEANVTVYIHVHKLSFSAMPGQMSIAKFWIEFRSYLKMYIQAIIIMNELFRLETMFFV